jgi:CDP-glucose 4,6-dehydratase
VHYLVTGHTGFKGAWLTMMLSELGHMVSGIALDPEPESLFESANVSELLQSDFRQDIRDGDALAKTVRSCSPDVVMHLAAQPIVRESYIDPRGTVETNVIGTMNVLDAVRGTTSVQAQVIVTTDKVYRNSNQRAGYVESDPLGGHDPYSASKAMADILTESWVLSFEGPPTATARAGNVIGGGDMSADRLLPDLVRAFRSGDVACLRYPDAVRPWQHVLDCLNGYLDLANALLAGGGQGAWNFGPGDQGLVTVGNLANSVAEMWGTSARWEATHGQEPHEATLLALDSHRAESELGWRNHLDYSDAVAWTVSWYQRVCAGEAPRQVTQEQIAAFIGLTAAQRSRVTQ